MLSHLYWSQINSEASRAIQNSLTSFSFSKIAVALGIIALAYLSLTGLEKITIWVSEKVALQLRQWLKKYLPLLQFVILVITVYTISDLFLKLSPSNVIAIGGTIAFALGFAFKDYISSVIAGVVVLFEAPYRVGDRVQIGEHYGEVITFGLRSFRIRTLTDDIVTVPHSHIWTNPISNANDGSLKAQVATDFYLNHNADTELACRILYKAATTSKYTKIQLPIVVTIQEELFATHLQIKAYPIDPRAEKAYQTDLSMRAKEAFCRYGIR
ncbi:MAG: mechanosensitive ion channel family protein [Cyanobacteriota bacterium]|nr:mechanosensitive ion channel family protein [Cyanobacteriota bacterium]